MQYPKIMPWLENVKKKSASSKTDIYSFLGEEKKYIYIQKNWINFGSPSI